MVYRLNEKLIGRIMDKDSLARHIILRRSRSVDARLCRRRPKSYEKIPSRPSRFQWPFSMSPASRIRVSTPLV